MEQEHSFRRKLRFDYSNFLNGRKELYPEGETLKMDLHCHDHNSDVTEELWGRILRLPETWLKTDDLVKCLRSNGADVITITNHNNARSCWDLLDRGVSVVPGAEFTCHLNEMEVGIHVLTYGFTPEQEERLKVLRRDIYKFVAYTVEHDLPTVLPHPLYFYSPKNRPTQELFEKFALLFERFEVLNGQRDLWQNMLTVEWLQSITPEKLEMWGRKHGIRPDEFCRDPYHKRMTGGSDDHMGIFAGSCGSLLHVPNLKELVKTRSPADLALDALRTGGIAPFGILGEEEKLNVAFLDYFCQVAMNMEDPGLVRMFLHQGSLKDKLMCLAAGNGIQEIRRHRYTMRFLRAFHEALAGRKPKPWTGWLVSRDTRPMVASLTDIAQARFKDPEAFRDVLGETVPKVFQHFNKVLAQRLNEKWTASVEDVNSADAAAELIRRLEVPSHLRALFGADEITNNEMSHTSLGKMFDNLSFPLLASGLIAGSSFASTRVLYKNRAFLNAFADNLGRYRHPRRALWLTDTFHDRNGVSGSLSNTLKQIKRLGLPIDFLVCSEKLESGPNLHVVKPVAEFFVPGFPEQKFRVPNLLEIQKIFRDGGYECVLCSTELLMGVAALYLKNAFSVPAWFYMHTDWLDFFRKRTGADNRSLDRVRRFLRAFYKQFEGIFVLSTDHGKWLSSSAIGIQENRIRKTAHWTGPEFRPPKESRAALRAELMPEIGEHDKVLLYAGRLSKEKGVLEIPKIYEIVSRRIPDIKVAIAGTGPSVEELQEAMPDATFLGWVPKDQLARVYAAVDMMVFPSGFDTFGNAVLEALSCGHPGLCPGHQGTQGYHQTSGVWLSGKGCRRHG